MPLKRSKRKLKKAKKKEKKEVKASRKQLKEDLATINKLAKKTLKA
jgi:hypothetical protein